MAGHSEAGAAGKKTKIRKAGKKMRFLVVSLIGVFLSVLAAASAVAVPPGMTVQWDSPEGTVVFDGQAHAAAGVTCGDCHPAIFQMKDGADSMTMADMNAGRYCGVCHNGQKLTIQLPGAPHGTGAFDVKDPANCTRCHNNQAGPMANPMGTGNPAINPINPINPMNPMNQVVPPPIPGR